MNIHSINKCSLNQWIFIQSMNIHQLNEYSSVEWIFIQSMNFHSVRLLVHYTTCSCNQCRIIIILELCSTYCAVASNITQTCPCINYCETWSVVKVRHFWRGTQNYFGQSITYFASAASKSRIARDISNGIPVLSGSL